MEIRVYNSQQFLPNETTIPENLCSVAERGAEMTELHVAPPGFSRKLVWLYYVGIPQGNGVKLGM